MDVYWVNCFLASGLAFILGMLHAERKFKRMLSQMVLGRAGFIGSPPKDTSDDK
jgi:hypothetical protein